MKTRAGFALLAAIVALVLIAVLVTGALYASSQESHSAGAELLDQKLMSLAERVTVETTSNWACAECDLLPPGSVIIRNQAPSPPLESTVYITRLDSAVFLVTGEARITTSSVRASRRRASIAVKITRDSLGVFSASRIHGDSWIIAYGL
jgi:hypothetical protein